jgi:hypothetical protein
VPVVGSPPGTTVAVTGSPTAVVVVAREVEDAGTLEGVDEGTGDLEVGGKGGTEVVVVLGSAVGGVVGDPVVVVVGSVVVVAGASTATVVVVVGLRISPFDTTRALHCTVSTAVPDCGAVVRQLNDGVDWPVVNGPGNVIAPHSGADQEMSASVSVPSFTPWRNHVTWPPGAKDWAYRTVS